MTRILETPNFQNEAEEAAWWDSHPDEALAIFEQAAKDSTLGHGTLARRFRTASASIYPASAAIELERKPLS